MNSIKRTTAMTSALMLTVTMAAANSRVPSADGPASVASVYVADFVSTAANGLVMNDAGDVAGTSYQDTGCGPFCLPPQDTVVWRGGARIVLPSIPGLPGVYVAGINSQGWVVGFAGFPNTTTHAVLWQPNGGGYTATDLLTLPGTTRSTAVGVDNLGRVVGWSTTANFPPQGAPFLWTQATGMSDLTTLGFPADSPLYVSPAGVVATAGFRYQLGNPGSVVPVPAPPSGWFPPGGFSTAISDSGDRATFLVSTGNPSLVYPFRMTSLGTWQQLSTAGTGSLSAYGIGGVTNAGDVSLTVLGTAMVAAGPSGVAQSLAPLLSPAYQGSSVVKGGAINSSGQILAHVLLGASQRVMRLTPAAPCTSNCIRVSKLQIRGKFVQDPAHPGQCFQNGIMYNNVQVKITVTSESGAPLSGVLVNGRFLDNYWTDKPVSGTTNAQGTVQFSNKGPCGVGTVSFLVDKATLGVRAFDRTTGIVTNSVIPQ